MQYQPRARLPKHRRPFTVVVEQLEDRLVPGETLTGLLFLPGDLSPLCGGDTGQIAVVDPSAPAVASGSGSTAAPASLLSTNAEQQAAALLPSSDAGAAMAEPELHARPERHPHGGGSPAGYSPAQIRHAYGFDQLTKDGTGITIGIIDAYDDPTIQSDLNTFSTQFGLPTTGSGTFTFTQA